MKPFIGERCTYFAAGGGQAREGDVVVIWRDDCINVRCDDGSTPASVPVWDGQAPRPTGHYCILGVMRAGEEPAGPEGEAGQMKPSPKRDVLSVVADWALLSGHITSRGVTCEAGDAIRGAAAAEVAAERQRCATDIAFELHMCGTPTWDEVLQHLRLLYRDRADALQRDLSRPHLEAVVQTLRQGR